VTKKDQTPPKIDGWSLRDEVLRRILREFLRESIYSPEFKELSYEAQLKYRCVFGDEATGPEEIVRDCVERLRATDAERG
jgi:hypothetical protein